MLEPWTIIGLIVVVVAIFAFVHERIRTIQFEKTHPELTDEEYLALFEWDVDPAIALKVRRIMAEISGVEESQIRPQDTLIKDLGLE